MPHASESGSTLREPLIVVAEIALRAALLLRTISMVRDSAASAMRSCVAFTQHDLPEMLARGGEVPVKSAVEAGPAAVPRTPEDPAGHD